MAPSPPGLAALPPGIHPPASQLFPGKGEKAEAMHRGWDTRSGGMGTQHSHHEDAGTDGKAQGTPSDTQDLSTTPARVSAGFCAPTALTTRERNFSERVSGCSSHGFGPGSQRQWRGRGQRVSPSPSPRIPACSAPSGQDTNPGEMPAQTDPTARPVGSPGGGLVCGATRDGSSRQRLCRFCPAGLRHGHSEEPPSLLKR